MSRTTHPSSRDVIDHAREAMRPTPEALLRVKAKLVASMTAAPEPRLLPVPLIFKALAGLALAAAGIWAAQHSDSFRGSRPEQVSSAPVCPPPATPPVTVVAPVQCPDVPACPAPSVRVVQAAPQCPERATSSTSATSKDTRLDLFSRPIPRDDRWGLEVGLLNDARVALDEGQAIGALGHVQRHHQLFPHSAFQEERLALEVLSYCALERKDLAVTPLEQLVQLAPESTYLPRVHDACGPLSETREDAGLEE